MRRLQWPRFLLAVFTLAFIPIIGLPFALLPDSALAQEPAVEDVAADSPDANTEETDPGWPRVIDSGDLTLTVYQPQIEKFDGITLEARAAVAVESKDSLQAKAKDSKDSQAPSYGVLWIHADADVDKEGGLVHLSNIELPRVSFPGAPDSQDEFLTILRENTEASRTISLARVQANLAMTATQKESRRVPVKNDPPRVFYSPDPAILVLVDGKPMLRPAGQGSPLERVINTRALILHDPDSRRYELTVMAKWFTAPDVEGPWSPDASPPEAAETLRESLATAQDAQVDLLEDPDEDVKDAFDRGVAPKIFVSTAPAELIVTQGKPQLQPIPGTELLWVQNTKNKLLFEVAGQRFDVQFSGRWYRAASLLGAWEFVENDRLPADFAKIPEKHPAGSVLASVAGTTQAKEAAIADEIPQTAQVRRSETTIQTQYDGDPAWEDIEDTSLSYARNSPTPVIRVAPDSYFAVDDGVWYTASAPLGPWIVATDIPLAIYSIPISCPIHYVTYVRVYRSSPEFVWVGYTPGYLGACLAPWGTVVYGSGWYYPPWIGSVWLGAPWTFGFGISVDWDYGYGWAVNFGRPFWRPWWGPVGWGWGRPRPPIVAWRPGRTVRFAHVNVYRALPARAVVPRAPARPGRVTTMNGYRARPGATVPRTQTAPRPGTLRAAPDVYAGRDGRVYRPSSSGWEQNDGKSWRALPPEQPVVRSAPAPRPEAVPVPRPSTSELTLERRAREMGSNRAAPRSAPPPAPRPAPQRPPRS